MVYSKTAVCEGKFVFKSDHLSIFTPVKHLVMLLKCNFSRLHIYTLSKTLVACRAMELNFFKVEVLINAFKGIV